MYLDIYYNIILYSCLALYKLRYFNLGKYMQNLLRENFQVTEVGYSLEHYRSHTGPLFKKHSDLPNLITAKPLNTLEMCLNQVL